MYYYEVLWYEGKTEEEAMQGDPKTAQFHSRLSAIDYYSVKKLELNRWGWWITKRNQDDEILEDIIY